MKYLIAIIALILPSYLIRFKIFGIPTTFLELFIYLVFLTGLILAIKNKIKCEKDEVWLPAGLFLLSAIIAVFISPLKNTALGEMKAFFIDPLLVLWLVLTYIRSKDFGLILGSLGLSALFVSAHAIWQYLSQAVTSDGRVIGIFGYSPNYMALFLAPITVMFIGYTIEFWKKRSIDNLGMIGAIFFYLVAIYLSGSRAGLLVVGAGAIAYLVFKYLPLIQKKIQLKIGLVFFIIIVVLSAWYVFKPNFNLSPETGGRVTSSNNIRWQIWETSVELGSKSPLFGLGLGNFQDSFTELTKTRANFPEFISPWALTPHNLYLTFWLNAGLFGLIAFIWVLILFYKDGLKNKGQIAIILMAAMTAILLQGLVDTPYFKNDLSLIFWLIVGNMLILKKG